MVEPQEPKASEKVLKAQAKFAEIAHKNCEGLPAEMIATAENKVEIVRSVKSEIDQKMMEVHERLSKVKQLIKDNVQGENCPTGVFNGKE